LPIDISSKVGRAITDSNPRIVPKTVRFDDVPVIIKTNPDIRIDEYDIIRDIKDQKANVTIRQLLHDNTNYQKLIREAWTRRRKKKFKLPLVAVNFSQPEDSGAPKVIVEVEGCSIPKVPVDGRSEVNLMLEETAFDLGYTAFEAKDQVLRMADQSRVNPVGKLSQAPTRIGGVTYLLNFVIIRVQT
jgi:Fe-S-cluster formation regulator IscX/YfhJ